MIDMSAMKGIRADPARRTVRAQTGVKSKPCDSGSSTALGFSLQHPFH